MGSRWNTREAEKRAACLRWESPRPAPGGGRVRQKDPLTMGPVGPTDFSDFSEHLCLGLSHIFGSSCKCPALLTNRASGSRAAFRVPAHSRASSLLNCQRSPQEGSAGLHPASSLTPVWLCEPKEVAHSLWAFRSLGEQCKREGGLGFF